MTDSPKISPTENGPFIVENPPSITGKTGETLETGGKVALCRCGASGNKPFCDGSHAKVGFNSTPDRSKIRNTPIEYKGTADGVAVTIGYTPVLCTHAGECQKRALAVFNPKQDPWIQPDGGSLEAILDVMAGCPSGALRISVADLPEQHLTTGDVGIHVQKNGPYYVTNVAVDAGFNGTRASHAKYALCRCGLSKNKPFCDGSHFSEGWSDD